jgi:hypothetical protein
MSVDSTTAAFLRNDGDNDYVPPNDEQPAEEDIPYVSLNEEMEIIAFDLIEIPSAYPLGLLCFDTEDVSVFSNISTSPSCDIVPKALYSADLITQARTVSKPWSGDLQAIQTSMDEQLSSIAKSGHDAVLSTCCGGGGVSLIRGKSDDEADTQVEGTLATSNDHNLSGDPAFKTSPQHQETEDSVEGGTAPVSVSSCNEAKICCGSSEQSKNTSTASSSREARICDMTGTVRDISLSSLEDEDDNNTSRLYGIEMTVEEAACRLGGDSVEGNTRPLCGIEMTLEEAPCQLGSVSVDDNEASWSISDIHEDTICDMVGSMQDIATASHEHETKTIKAMHAAETERGAQTPRVKLSYGDHAAVDSERKNRISGAAVVSSTKAKGRKSIYWPRPHIIEKLKRLIKPKRKGCSKGKGKAQAFGSTHRNVNRRSGEQPAKASADNSKEKKAQVMATSWCEGGRGGELSTTASCKARKDDDQVIDYAIPRDESAISDLYAATVSSQPTIDTYLDTIDLENDVFAPTP